MTLLVVQRFEASKLQNYDVFELYFVGGASDLVDLLVISDQLILDDGGK